MNQLMSPLCLSSTAITCTSKSCTWNHGSLKHNPSAANKRQYDSFKIDVLRRSSFDNRATRFQKGPTRVQMNNFLAALSYKETPCAFQTLLTLTYDDFSYSEEDLEIIRSQRDMFMNALKELHDELKPCPEHVGPFAVKGTEDQNENEWWGALRALHGTASECRKIRHFRTEGAKMNFLRRHMWRMNRNVKTKQMAYGTRNEPIARKAYLKERHKTDPSVEIEEAGINLHTENVGASTSHDGKVKSKHHAPRVLEIKCPWLLRNPHPKDFDSVLPKKKLPKFCFRRNERGKIRLKKESDYYDQVQMEMGMRGMQECDFVVWSKKGYVILTVPFDQQRWNDIKCSLLKFHKEYMVPEYFAMRTPRKLHPIRME